MVAFADFVQTFKYVLWYRHQRFVVNGASSTT